MDREELIAAAHAAIEPLISPWYAEDIEDDRAFAVAAVDAILAAQGGKKA